MKKTFVIVLLWTSLLFANTGESLLSFYQHLYEQDEKDLYEYLLSELTGYMDNNPDSAYSADMSYLLAKSHLARGQEHEALAACYQTLYLYPGYANRQECIGFATNIITTNRSFRSEQEKYTALLNQTVPGVMLEDRNYAYLDMLVKLNESRLYDWTLHALETFCLLYPGESRLDEVLKWTAELYLEKGDEWRAVASYQKLEAMRPNSPLLPSARLSRAKLLYDELGAHEQAAQAFQQIAITWPGMEEAPEALFLCAFVYEDKIHDYENAILYYRRLVDTYPQYVKSVKALLSIGEIYNRRLDKPKEAIAAFNEFVEKYRTNPNGVEALTRVAEIYDRNLNDYAKAAEYYALVAEYYPTYDKAPDMLMKAGELSEDKLNDYNKAIHYYQMLLNTFPEHKRARDAEKKIERARENLNAN